MLLRLHTLALLLLRLLLLLLPPPAQILSIVCLVPLTERIGIDLHDGCLGQGVCAHELIVRRVERDGDDTNFARDALTTPGEVAGVETQSAELAVAATGADQVDALAADTGVGRLPTFLERSVVLIIRSCLVMGMWQMRIGLCIPLLAIVCALSTRGAALVTRVTRDTVRLLALVYTCGCRTLMKTVPHDCDW